LTFLSRARRKWLLALQKEGLNRLLRARLFFPIKFQTYLRVPELGGDASRAAPVLLGTPDLLEKRVFNNARDTRSFAGFNNLDTRTIQPFPEVSVMRLFGKLVLTLALVLGFVAVVESQQQRQLGGPPRQGTNSLNLVQNPAVQKELNISEEQLKKLPAAVQKALAEVLDPNQVKRLRQIELQQRGPQALADAKVAQELKLSETQSEKIKTILEDSRKETAELFKGGNRESFQKLGALRKETQEKVQNVLTEEQKSAWKNLVGEEFKMPTFPGFGGKDQPKRPFNKRKTTR
jgi:hypothetical protein